MSSATASLKIELSGLRNAKGMVRMCIASSAKAFPECKNEQRGRSLSIPVPANGRVEVSGLSYGDYAIAVFHDENGNGRLDTMMGIPREGFGFSRNPSLMAGPPAFSRARFDFATRHLNETIRIKYIL